MVTPRKPNAKRGRPSKDFWIDQDRIAIAVAMALQMVGGTSERAAYVVVAVHALGRKVEEHVMASARRKRGVGEIKAGTTVSRYERIPQFGETTTSFIGYASTLRRKKDRWQQDPQAVAWLRAGQMMIAAFLRTALEDGGDFQQLVRFIFDLARRASRNSRSPELTPHVSAQERMYHHQQEAMPMLTERRDFYAALSNPSLAAPVPSGSPRSLSVIICEDEVAELIQMDPAALASASRGQLAVELAKVISDWMETRAA